MNKLVWLGVDLSKESFEVALASRQDRPEDWEKLAHQAFAFDKDGLCAAVRWVEKKVGTTNLGGVCLESTGRLGWDWIESMDGRLGPVSMVNPLRPKRFGESMGVRHKDDRVDACILALYGVAMRPRETELPSPALKELRDLNRLFTALSKDRQAYGQRLMEAPKNQLMRREIKRTIDHLERRMKSIQKRIDELMKDSTIAQDVAHITSIKGVGRRTACVLLGELGDLRNYSRGEIAGAAGVYPCQFTSGKTVQKQAHMAKRGGAPVRKVLYLCAMSAVQHNPQIKRFYEQLLKNGKCKMTALGAVMRKLLLLARTLVITNTNFDPNYQTPGARAASQAERAAENGPDRCSSSEAALSAIT